MAPRKKNSANEFGANDVLDMMSADVGEKPKNLPSSENLGKLANMVKEMLSLETEIAEMQEKMAELSKKHRDLSGNQIPDLFDEMGLSEIKLTDRTKVGIKRGFVGSITKKFEKEAFDWLVKNGHGAIIKKEFVVKLKKGEDEVADMVRDDLNCLEVPYNEKESVHASTLKAFINEQMEAGADIPQETFSVYPVRQTIIKTM